MDINDVLAKYPVTGQQREIMELWYTQSKIVSKLHDLSNTITADDLYHITMKLIVIFTWKV